MPGNLTNWFDFVARDSNQRVMTYPRVCRVGSTGHICLWTVLVLLVVVGARDLAAASTIPWQAIVVGKQTEAERLATIDLQRYLGQVSGQVPVVLSPDEWRKHPRPAVALGTVDSNSLIQMSVGTRAKLGGQGYRLEQREIEGSAVVTAAGATAEGAVNAIAGRLAGAS